MTGVRGLAETPCTDGQLKLLSASGMEGLWRLLAMYFVVCTCWGVCQWKNVCKQCGSIAYTSYFISKQVHFDGA